MKRMALLCLVVLLVFGCAFAETWQEIDARFIALYGDKRDWTLEEWHAWDLSRVAAGVGDRVYYVLPDENDLSLEKALAIAEKEVCDAKWGEIKHYDASSVDLASYDVSCCFIEYDDGERMYLIRYYGDAYTQPIFDVTVYQSGVGTVDFYDADSMENIYLRAIGERGEKFAYWTIADKRAFYETLLQSFEREMTVYGGLPPFAKAILSHEQSLPLEGEIGETEALAAARNAARDIDWSGGVREAVYLYRDAGGDAVYEITFVRGVTPLKTVRVRASDGAVLAQ